MAYKVPNVVGPKPFHQGYALGVVVAKHHNKTLRVIVKRALIDRKYKKRFTRYTNFKVHDELNECNLGDVVLIKQSKPHSKTKFFEVADTAKRYAASSYLKNNPEVKEFFDNLSKGKSLDDL